MTKKRKFKKGVIPKLLFLLAVFILILLAIVFIFKKVTAIKYKEYTKTLNYMDTVIDIKIYSNNENEANTIISEIEKIYKHYHELTDRYNKYDGINNVYIINNTKEIAQLDIDKDLYEILNYSVNWYYKSNGLFNINIGNLTDLWKKYRDNKTGIPTNDELYRLSGLDIKHIVSYNDNKILTGNVNLDLGGIAKGYATEVVHHYLKSIGFERYLINAGGTVLAGINSEGNKYKVGLQDPDNASAILKDGDKEIKLNLSNAIITSSGGYERFYEFNGVRYHHILNPNTKMPANNMKSVSVITDDAMLGDVMSTTLFLMSVEDGQKFIENFDNVEAIWYTNDNKVIKSSGVQKYE
ncbi:MAG: FAD:protein FMN transferase [Bacilli bacterium]|nr:FAD:protein FMN transferase [Bacilli bacterium]